MKYNICGYSQAVLLKYNLDCNDAVLLRTVMDIYTSSSDKIDYVIRENDKFMWLTYRYISEQLQLLGSIRTVQRKIDNFIDKKILKKVILNSKNKRAGKYMYLAPGENYSELCEYDFYKMTEDSENKNKMPDCHDSCDKTALDHTTNCHIKDSSITDYSNKIINKKRESVPHMINLILGKYNELNLPSYVRPPKNYTIMDCYNSYGIADLYKALKMMSESSYVMKNFSIDMIFNTDNIRKALNGSFKDKFPVKPKENREYLNVSNDKVYEPNKDNEELYKILGLR